MSSDNFSGKIMHDLWQAVKSAQQAPTARASLAKRVRKNRSKASRRK